MGEGVKDTDFFTPSPHRPFTPSHPPRPAYNHHTDMPNPISPPPAPDDRITITCLYCSKPQEVSRRALTVTCKYCNRSLRIEDIRIKAGDYTARRTIDTCGVVTVEKKGQAVVTEKIHCGGMI